MSGCTRCSLQYRRLEFERRFRFQGVSSAYLLSGQQIEAGRGLQLLPGTKALPVQLQHRSLPACAGKEKCPLQELRVADVQTYCRECCTTARHAQQKSSSCKRPIGDVLMQLDATELLAFFCPRLSASMTMTKSTHFMTLPACMHLALLDRMNVLLHVFYIGNFCVREILNLSLTTRPAALSCHPNSQQHG